MSDDPTRDGRPAADDDQELGRPVTELERLDQTTSPGFLVVLRHRIERRQLTGEFAAFGWHLPKTVVVEFLKVFFELFDWRKDPKGDEK